MKLVVGLGNPGAQYARTRHNIGFMVVDMLTGKWKDAPKLKSLIASEELAPGQKHILAKPQTFMNLSGEAVQRIMQFYKFAPEDVWVIFDDVDVPFGRMRLRIGGSSSGHQGVKSIIQHIGPNFVRARIGISLNDRSKESSEEYVLKPFNDEEQKVLSHVIWSASADITAQLSSPTVAESTFDLLS